jgi:hypothetical protein
VNNVIKSIDFREDGTTVLYVDDYGITKKVILKTIFLSTFTIHEIINMDEHKLILFLKSVKEFNEQKTKEVY